MLILVSASQIMQAASTKEAEIRKKHEVEPAGDELEKKTPGPESTAPREMKKALRVLSDLDKQLMEPIIELINSATGLECILVESGSFDVFAGFFSHYPAEKILHYHSARWGKKQRESGHSSINFASKNGVYTWSLWQSCFVFNKVLVQETEPAAGGKTPAQKDDQEKISPVPEELQGKITAMDPRADPLTLSVFYTLYKKYGIKVLRDLDRLIPVYYESRTRLTQAVESGRYAGAYTIDGYFNASVHRGYPLRITSTSISPLRYPLTAVQGKNTAFIPRASHNPEGAKLFIDFLAADMLQEHLEKSAFIPIAASTVPKAEEGKQVEFLPAEYHPEQCKELIETWENIAFPEGVDESLLREHKLP